MQFKQFYLGCLSHASYYLGSADEAVVIDPQRDVQHYLDEAAANGQRIKYIIETHSHADFVSGHLELAGKTGAEIIYGQRAKTRFPTHFVSDTDELMVGAIKLRFLETPGHTPEGITIIAQDSEDPAAPLKMFTGDTLFIGDVGRPDLIGSKGFTAEQMGEMLYYSLHNSILAYPDETEVYPAHGAGSLCGKSLSKETWSTLGEQRQFNYALQPMSVEEFITIVAADQPEVPMYFPKSAAKNLEGSISLDDIAPPRRLSTEEALNFDGVVVDVRSSLEYGAAHIPNAVNIWLSGQFASWAGTMIPIGTAIAIAADTLEQVEEAVMRLARIGHDTAEGYILMKDFTGETRSVEQVSVGRLNEVVDGDIQLIDVRRVAEYNGSHAVRAVNLPLDKLPNDLKKLDPERDTYVICQSGYRSSLATSILENAGFKKLFNVEGGTAAWIANGLSTESTTAACSAS